MSEDDDLAGWHFDGYQHWTELFARRGYNWKNFTFVVLEVEYADYLRPHGYVEIHVGFMGFGFLLTYFPPGPKTEGMKELEEAVRRAEEGPWRTLT